MYRSGVPIGPDRRIKIARLHQQGLSLRELAARFDISYWTVRNELLTCRQSGTQERPEQSPGASALICHFAERVSCGPFLAKKHGQAMTCSVRLGDHGDGESHGVAHE